MNIDRAYLEARLKELQQQRENAIKQVVAVDGAIQLAEQLLAALDIEDTPKEANAVLQMLQSKS
jgi:hypothetical protein